VLPVRVIALVEAPQTLHRLLAADKPVEGAVATDGGLQVDRDRRLRQLDECWAAVSGAVGAG
jgi:hypothetical protein